MSPFGRRHSSDFRHCKDWTCETRYRKTRRNREGKQRKNRTRNCGTRSRQSSNGEDYFGAAASSLWDKEQRSDLPESAGTALFLATSRPREGSAYYGKFKSARGGRTVSRYPLTIFPAVPPPRPPGFLQRKLHFWFPADRVRGNRVVTPTTQGCRLLSHVKCGFQRPFSSKQIYSSYEDGVRLNSSARRG